jgi:hypothetical protein
MRVIKRVPKRAALPFFLLPNATVIPKNVIEAAMIKPARSMSSKKANKES